MQLYQSEGPLLEQTSQFFTAGEDPLLGGHSSSHAGASGSNTNIARAEALLHELQLPAQRIGGVTRASAPRRSSTHTYQPQGVPALIARKPGASSHGRISRTGAEHPPDWGTGQRGAPQPHPPVIGLASLLGGAATGGGDGAVASGQLPQHLQQPLQRAGPSFAGSDVSLPGQSLSLHPGASSVPGDHTGLHGAGGGPNGGPGAWHSALPPVSESGSPVHSPQGARVTHYLPMQQSAGGRRITADSLTGVTSGRSLAGVGPWDRLAPVPPPPPPALPAGQSEAQQPQQQGRGVAMGAYPPLGAEAGSPRHGTGAHEQWDVPPHIQAQARFERMVQILEEANSELQERLVAAGAAHAEAQAAAASQVAALESAQQALEDQAADLSEKLEAGEAALEAAHRQDDARAAEIRRLQEQAAEGERARMLLDAEVAGLKEALSDMRKELEAANRKVLMEEDTARRADSELQMVHRELQAVTEAMDKARADGNDLRERLRAMEADTMRKLAACDLEAERLAQQLRDAKEKVSALEARGASLEVRNTDLQQQLATSQVDVVFLRRELEATRSDASSARAAAMAAATAHAAVQQDATSTRAAAVAAATAHAAAQQQHQQALRASAAQFGGYLPGSYVYGGPPGTGYFESGHLDPIHSSSTVFRESSQQQFQQQQQPYSHQIPAAPSSAQLGRAATGLPLTAEQSWATGYGGQTSPGGRQTAGQQQQQQQYSRPATSAPSTVRVGWATPHQQQQQQVSAFAQAGPSLPPYAVSAPAGVASPGAGSYGAYGGSYSPGTTLGGAAAPTTPRGGGGGGGALDGGVSFQEGTPYGTEMSVQQLMSRTKEVEDVLLHASQERDELESELARMPLGGGRTLRQRERKEYVEARLDELRKQISSARMQIKRLIGK